MIQIIIAIGPIVLVNAKFFEDTSEGADEASESDAPALPFGFVMVERSSEVEDPIFR